MNLLEGKKVAEILIKEIAQEVRIREIKGKKRPHLAAILAGDNHASRIYVTNKIKACHMVNFKSTLYEFEDTVSEKFLLEKIQALNNDDDIDGFIVQLPLPFHINEKRVIQAIHPDKDIDGFHPVNIGKMLLNIPTYLPATSYGILQLLEYYNIETEGKNCVVIGRSHIVGLPTSMLMVQDSKRGNCTVTLTHSKTKNIKEISKGADILIAALGKAEFVTADMVKDGAVVIDIGINRVPDKSKKTGFTLKGDIKFDEVAPKCAFITPVPGGVGPMTVVSLLKNTLIAALRRIKE